MPTVSICINLDSRPQNNKAETMFNGTTNLDYLTDGIRNKQLFFSGFDVETVVFVDRHLEIPQDVLKHLYDTCDTVVIRKHTSEPKFNDWNYWSALAICRGDIICHFDQDCNAFTSSKEAVQEMIDLLDKYDYVSYPSHWSPDPCHDPNYDYFWCSTRFFMCKRETLDFTQIKKCLEDMEYLYTKYPASVKNPWFEHVIGLISKYTGKGVFYPNIDLNKLAIFSWATYESWTLRRLNELPYEEIKQFIYSKNGIQYPNDIYI